MARYGKMAAMTRDAFEDAPMVTLAQLGRLVGLDRRRLRRILAGDGVPLLRTGNRHCVCPRSLRRLMPDFYEALVAGMCECGK